jgi:hypothetical protein
MMVTRLQSTNQAEKFSGVLGVMSAPVGCRGLADRVLKRVIEVDDAPSDGVGVLVVGDFQRGQYALLVASRLRIAQIVHHSVEGAAQAFVGNVLGTNADKKDCGGGQALLHAAGAGGDRTHGLHQEAIKAAAVIFRVRKD